MCFPCMAEYLECSEDDLREKVEEFKREGCKLFS
jgi:biotin operon repressor